LQMLLFTSTFVNRSCTTLFAICTKLQPRSYAINSMDNRSNVLVTPEWLADNLSNVKVVDASWCMPNEKKDVRADFAKLRLPGSVLFDIDDVADKATPLPHMVPSVEQFEKQVGMLGINADDYVVAYDTSGKYVASARVWWTFRLFGHKKIAVLEGGLPKWLSCNMPTDSGMARPPRAERYKAQYIDGQVKNFEQMKSNLQTKDFEVVDARPGDRWKGKVAEPRAGLKSGHIPNSVNVPWASVLDAKAENFLSNEELISQFKKQGVSFSSPIVTSCGSGVTAAVLTMGLHMCGIESAIYDGSFAEWGDPKMNAPVEKS